MRRRRRGDEIPPSPRGGLRKLPWAFGRRLAGGAYALRHPCLERGGGADPSTMPERAPRLPRLPLWFGKPGHFVDPLRCGGRPSGVSFELDLIQRACQEHHRSSMPIMCSARRGQFGRFWAGGAGGGGAPCDRIVSPSPNSRWKAPFRVLFLMRPFVSRAPSPRPAAQGDLRDHPARPIPFGNPALRMTRNHHAVRRGGRR